MWGVLFFAGALMAMMSPMMFDSPGSESNPHVIALFAAVVSFPILCLVSIVATWLTWRFTRDAAGRWRRRWPLVSAALPVLSIVAFAIAAIIQGNAPFSN